MKLPFWKKSATEVAEKFKSEKKNDTMFSDDFFRFLLVFSFFILCGFAVILLAQ